MSVESSAPAVHEYRLLITERHLDTFGHVNNATYLQLFEEARWDWITSRGYGLAEIERTRLGPVILEAKLKFRREVRNREQVLIRTRLGPWEGKVGTVHQRLIRGDGQAACLVELVCGLWNLDERRLIQPTESWARAIGLDWPLPESGDLAAVMDESSRRAGESAS